MNIVTVLHNKAMEFADEAWAPERREVPDPTGVDRGGRQLAVRLSDHAPVEALFGLGAGG